MIKRRSKHDPNAELKRRSTMTKCRTKQDSNADYNSPLISVHIRSITVATPNTVAQKCPNAKNECPTIVTHAY